MICAHNLDRFDLSVQMLYMHREYITFTCYGLESNLLSPLFFVITLVFKLKMFNLIITSSKYMNLYVHKSYINENTSMY